MKEGDFSFVAEKRFFPLSGQSHFMPCRAGLVLASVFQWGKVLLVFSHPLSQLGGPVDRVQNLFRPVSDMRIAFPAYKLQSGRKN